MRACHFFRHLIIGLAMMPSISNAQNEVSANMPSAGANLVRPARFSFSEPGNDISCNVPLNEINIHAFRHFHHLFPSGTSGEYWYKSAEGYQVSFLLESQRHQAFFDRRGGFLYSLKYYAGEKIPVGTGELIRKRYLDYQIDVVTEITDGEKTFYLVKIENQSSVKTLSVCEGKIEVLEELVNGGIGK